MSTSLALQAAARWPRLRKVNGLAVIAANAPRRYTTRVTRHGRESLYDLRPGRPPDRTTPGGARIIR